MTEPVLTLPEFTRSLRGFAAPDALGTPEHDLVFGPLVAARRSAARVTTVEGRIAAFDAARLRRAWESVVASLATGRACENDAIRRAFVARFGDAGTDVTAALDELARAAEALRRAPDSTRSDAWSAWCAAIQRLFDAADRFWLAIPAVDAEAARDGIQRASPNAGRGSSRSAPIGARGASSGARGLALLLGLDLLAHDAEAQRRIGRVDGARVDSLLAAGFDVVGMDGLAPIVVAGPEDRDRLGLRGLRFVDLRPAAATDPANATAPVVYRSYDDPVRGVRTWMDSMARNNPRVRLDTIGRSTEGRAIVAMKVGASAESPGRPNVLFMATYHAREWAATETALRLVKWLAAAPGTDARRDSLLARRDIWVIPVANPDGYQFTFTNDRLWRKTRSSQGAHVGVDMNRNHSVNWGLDNQGSSGDQMSDVYRGPTPASEPETRAIEAFHAAYPPVASVSFHTFAGLLIYPPGATYGSLPADRPVYRALAGTHLRSAVIDRLPATIRTAYAPGPAWELYTTNGEYTDFASTRHGTIAFTVELTSGYGPSGFYGFEFADDETLLERLFQDNLPFALDVLDAAGNPAGFRSATTARGIDRITIESVSPEIRATVPAAGAASSRITIGVPLTFRVDSAGGGRHTRRIVADAPRPATFSIATDGVTAAYRVIGVNGAEGADPAWPGFNRDTVLPRAGAASWTGTAGSMTSTSFAVPSDADTISVVYWTRHFGSGFSPNPSARIELSADGGGSWTLVAVHRGSAPSWYPDGFTVGGVRGRSVQLRFTSDGMPWWLDEIAVVAHGAVSSQPVAAGATIVASENPVRNSVVRFTWPFGATPGEFVAYDIAGHQVWRRTVLAGEPHAWDIATGGVGNGVYVVVARAGARVTQLKLFVARPR